MRGLGSLLKRRSFHASSEAALVARSGVVVEDALLHALVERRNGLPELLVDGGGIALGEGLAQQAQAAADAALVGAVHRSLSLSLTGALQRRNMVSHDESLTFLEEWDAGRRDTQATSRAKYKYMGILRI